MRSARRFRPYRPPFRDLHDIAHTRRWIGTARIDRGAGHLSHAICAAFRFPAAADAMPVTVTMQREEDAETWLRDFGGRRFRSYLKANGPAGSGCVTERFGPFTFRIRPTPVIDRLTYPVKAGWLGPVPIPRMLLPRSEAAEAADGDAATFDVGLLLPGTRRLVCYRGRLRLAG